MLCALVGGELITSVDGNVTRKSLASGEVLNADCGDTTCTLLLGSAFGAVDHAIEVGGAPARLFRCQREMICLRRCNAPLLAIAPRLAPLSTARVPVMLSRGFLSVAGARRSPLHQGSSASSQRHSSASTQMSASSEVRMPMTTTRMLSTRSFWHEPETAGCVSICRAIKVELLALSGAGPVERAS